VGLVLGAGDGTQPLMTGPSLLMPTPLAPGVGAMLVVARGRVAGMVTVATTQKPSADVVPTFLRDLFGFRWALRRSTPQTSDTILGSG